MESILGQFMLILVPVYTPDLQQVCGPLLIPFLPWQRMTLLPGHPAPLGTHGIFACQVPGSQELGQMDHMGSYTRRQQPGPQLGP